MPSDSPSPSTDANRELFDLLARIDELESLRDQLDELGITTRAELEQRISDLEADAAHFEAERGTG